MDANILKKIKRKGGVLLKKEEMEIFYLYDQHVYLVENNAILRKILSILDNSYHESDVQNYINKLISWYMVKYSDLFLKSLFDEDTNTDTAIIDIMNFEQLQKSYGSFEEELFERDICDNRKIILQKYLVVMAGWGLVYQKKSNPEFGYYRACQLLNDFNLKYNWNLPNNIYVPVFNRDYSPDNEKNKQLLDNHRKKLHSKNEKKLKKMRFLFRK